MIWQIRCFLLQYLIQQMTYILNNPLHLNAAGTKCEILLRFLDLPVEVYRIKWEQLQTPEYLHKHPLGKIPTLETPEGTIYESATILRYLARKAGKFYGKTAAETASIDQWLEYVNTQVGPLSVRTIYGTLGYNTNLTKQAYEAGKKDYLQVLKIADNQLGKTLYLGGNEISIADMSLIINVRVLFRLVFDEKTRSALPNLVKWHNRLFEHKEISGFYGKNWLCTNELLPNFVDNKPKKQEKKVEVKEEKKVENKEEKKEEPKQKKEKKEKVPAVKKEVKKEEPKKKQDKKKKKEESDDGEQPEQKQEQKKKNPIDLLPKSPFNIDDWKREFVNAENKPETLKQLWPKFDHAGWSLWKIHYIKYEGQGVVGYLTNNLKNGHLRNIDHFRKYCFAVHGIYGVEGNYEIDGIWMWRGTEIPEEWKEHQSYDYFTFQKLDPKDQAVQDLTAQYWLNLNEGQLVEGKPVFQAKWFK